MLVSPGESNCSQPVAPRRKTDTGKVEESPKLLKGEHT